MTKVLTVRLTESELACCDALAGEMGLSRTDFVRWRLFSPEAAATEAGRRRFASGDLVGAFAVGTGSTNEHVRAAMGRRRRS